MALHDVVVQVHRREPAAVEQLHLVEQRADQFQLAEAVAVEHPPRHRRRVHARLHCPAADVERPRRDVRVVKGARVGEDGEVDVRGDFERQRHAERADQLEHQLPAGGRGLVEPVDLAVAAVALVMIDVDREAAVESFDAGARRDRRTPSR